MLAGGQSGEAQRLDAAAGAAQILRDLAAGQAAQDEVQPEAATWQICGRGRCQCCESGAAPNHMGAEAAPCGRDDRIQALLAQACAVQVCPLTHRLSYLGYTATI